MVKYAYILDNLNRKKEALKYFNKIINAGTHSNNILAQKDNYSLAQVYACLNNKPEAYKHLHALELQDFQADVFSFAQYDPLLQNLWNDQEFRDIIKRQEEKYVAIRKKVYAALAEQHLDGAYQNQ